MRLKYTVILALPLRRWFTPAMGLAVWEKIAKFREALKFCMTATSRLSPVLPQFPLLLCVGSVLEKNQTDHALPAQLSHSLSCHWGLFALILWNFTALSSSFLFNFLTDMETRHKQGLKNSLGNILMNNQLLRVLLPFLYKNRHFCINCCWCLSKFSGKTFFWFCHPQIWQLGGWLLENEFAFLTKKTFFFSLLSLVFHRKIISCPAASSTENF